MSTSKVNEHVPSMFPISLFNSIENKRDVYRGKDYEKVLWILKRARNENIWFQKKWSY